MALLCEIKLNEVVDYCQYQRCFSSSNNILGNATDLKLQLCMQVKYDVRAILTCTVSKKLIQIIFVLGMSICVLSHLCGTAVLPNAYSAQVCYSTCRLETPGDISVGFWG